MTITLLNTNILPRCAVKGCPNISIGSRYCARCEEELNAEPYPFANILLGWTFYQWMTRTVRRLWKRK